MLLDAIAILGGLLLLLVGADVFVRGAAALALRFGLSPLVVGLTVVAFGTSAPELVVSVESALEGHGGLALGNVFGSNVANVGLILGVCVLVRSAAVDPRLLRIDVPVLMIASLGVAALLLDGALSLVDGLVLLGALAAYLALTLKKPGGAVEVEAPEVEAAEPMWKMLAATTSGLAMLVFGGSWLVSGAVDFAAAVGVPEAVIGLTVIAVGTSLPELATSLVAALRGQSDIAVGNVIGSNIFNLLCVLGVASLVAPLGVESVGSLAVLAMVGAAALAAPMMWTGRRLVRWEGAVLLGAYVTYVSLTL
jgi:cation:H+ antiporter